MATRIRPPPMVGVPDFCRCDFGPSLRTCWPIWCWLSALIMRGPITIAIASAVIAARMPRRVRYWNT